MRLFIFIFFNIADSIADMNVVCFVFFFLSPIHQPSNYNCKRNPTVI